MQTPSVAVYYHWSLEASEDVHKKKPANRISIESVKDLKRSHKKNETKQEKDSQLSF